MPNLDHNPKNPSDLLGRPIHEGDIVGWGTLYGRSPGLAVCVIEKIRFIRKAPPGNWRVVNEECTQAQAEDYQLRLRPLKSTGHVSYIDQATGKSVWSIPSGADPKQFKAKTVTVKLVKNVVKIGLSLEETEALAYA